MHILARMHKCAHEQVMRERAQRGYVLDPDKNSEICGRLGQGELVRAWLQVAPLLPFERPCVHVYMHAFSNTMNQSVNLSFNPSIHLSIHPSLHLSIHPSLHLSDSRQRACRWSTAHVSVVDACLICLSCIVQVARLLSFEPPSAGANARGDLPEPATPSDQSNGRAGEGGGGTGREGDATETTPHWGVWGVLAVAEAFQGQESTHIRKRLVRSPEMALRSSSSRLDLNSNGHSGLAGSDSPRRRELGSGGSRALLSEGPAAAAAAAAGGGNNVVDVYVSECRRRVLHICEYDFGEAERFDGDMDYEGSEALEKRVTQLARKHQHAQAAFTRLLQGDLSSALECLFKGAGFEEGVPLSRKVG